MTRVLSTLNFRDIGGIPVDGGGRIRHGVIYRSEGPASFGDMHRAELAALGIRLVCDLRAETERSEAPNDWAQGARLLNLDLSNDLRDRTNEGWIALREDPSEAGARRAILLNYRAIPAALQPRITPLTDAIAAGEAPVLIHCTAGKDRTGVLVALLLMLLGVPKEETLRDYLRSEVYGRNLQSGGSITRAFEEAFGFTPSDATLTAIIGVDEAYLDAALDVVAEGWGSIENYFAGAGISGARLEALRAALVEPAA